MTKICAVAADVNSPEKAVLLGADAVEYRFDLFDKIPEKFSFNPRVTNIVTLRNTDNKSDFFKSALECGADFVDVESDSALRNEFGKENTICSFHDFTKTPSADEILKIFDDLKTSGLPKAAFTVKSATDLFEIYKASQILKKSAEKFILIGMGEAGELTRLRSGILGSEFNYCAFPKKSAPGQITLAEALNLKNPIVTGIVGFPLEHTFSPRIHNAAFIDAGICGRYVKIPCRADELYLVKELMSAYKISGLNVTIPHKENIIRCLPELSETAKAVGAVNTITKEFSGENTDAAGIAASLDCTNPVGKKVLLIGAGGAARAAAYYFTKAKADLTITNRTFEKAKVLADEFNSEAVEIDKLRFDYEIILNATPASPKIKISKDAVVMDMKYPNSEFLNFAKEAGAKTISGKTMLINQAAESFKIWTGFAPSVSVMDAAFEGEQ
ncbi:MAG: shikimate dehydrogenase [Methanocorpusculum sp.]|nr:shikimate dehydrogenase [Methanocorpusculum sp.]